LPADFLKLMTIKTIKIPPPPKKIKLSKTHSHSCQWPLRILSIRSWQHTFRINRNTCRPSGTGTMSVATRCQLNMTSSTDAITGSTLSNPRRRILFEKLILPAPVKRFRTFIIVFEAVHNLPAFSAQLIQFKPPHPQPPLFNTHLF
jgi:hypothetical protein